MAGNLANYSFGGGGVNLVKGPLELGDDEATKLQNAEYRADQLSGGDGALCKREGHAALNGSALAGALLGMVSLPLQTNYVRTMYASLGEFDSDTFSKTVNGTVWTSVQTLLAAARWDTSDHEGFGSAAQSGGRNSVSYKNIIFYPGNNYVTSISTPANNTSLPLVAWDGSNAFTVFSLPVGPSSSDGNFPFSVSDMIQANGIIYLAVHDPVNGGTLKGRVLAYDPAAATVVQVATGFSGTTGDMSGGAPACLAWHQGQLFVGLDNGNGTNGVGKVVRCYPAIDTAWTVDVSNLDGYPKSMAVYLGDLYVGIRGTASTNAAVWKRSQATGAWASSDALTTSGVAYVSGLIVYSGNLYATTFSDGGADVEKIRKFDGTTWSTDRDVAATDCTAGIAQHVGMFTVMGNDLYAAFKSIGYNTNDGFVLRKTGGTWSKVLTDNINGRLLVLTERS